MPGGPCFAARPDETLLEVARRDGVALPHECVWGSCGTCEVTLVSGETVLLCPAAPAISPRDQRSGWIVAGQSMARSDLAIRLSPAAPPSLPVPDLAHRAEPIAVEELGPELRRFTSGPRRRPISRPGNMPSSTSRRRGRARPAAADRDCRITSQGRKGE